LQPVLIGRKIDPNSYVDEVVLVRLVLAFLDAR
jgi:hypothetical protein